MRWEGRRESSNVKDLRRKRMKRVGGGLGLGTIVILGLALLFGEDPGKVLQQLQRESQVQSPSSTQAPVNTAEEELASFVKVVMADTEDVWNKLFREQLGQEYKDPILVLYTDQVQSACGFSTAATGPFYCPGDDQLYIDLSFYEELKRKFRAPGDFAMAYVVAHEVAHHVQNQLGISMQVQRQRGRVSTEEYNQLSVRMELQADFLAGVWAHHAQKMKSILQEGDVEEALRAANAIGDDTIQKRSRGYVVPESFTHGTAEQRMRWFSLGLKTGDISQGDTFGARNL